MPGQIQDESKKAMPGQRSHKQYVPSSAHRILQDDEKKHVSDNTGMWLRHGRQPIASQPRHPEREWAAFKKHIEQDVSLSRVPVSPWLEGKSEGKFPFLGVPLNQSVSSCCLQGEDWQFFAFRAEQPKAKVECICCICLHSSQESTHTL